MNVLAWLLMPGGRATHFYATGGTTLVAPTPGTTSGVSLRTVNKMGFPLQIDLDPEHDWLARRVELFGLPGGERDFWEVSRFERHGSRWFPAEGRCMVPTTQGFQPRRFRVTRVALNRPIDPSRFTAATPPWVGVMDNSGGKQTVTERGVATRLYTELYRAVHPADAPKPKTLPNPSLGRRSFTYPMTYGVIAAFIVGLVAACRWRRRRPDGPGIGKARPRAGGNAEDAPPP